MDLGKNCKSPGDRGERGQRGRGLPLLFGKAILKIQRAFLRRKYQYCFKRPDNHDFNFWLQKLKEGKWDIKESDYQVEGPQRDWQAALLLRVIKCDLGLPDELCYANLIITLDLKSSPHSGRSRFKSFQGKWAQIGAGACDLIYDFVPKGNSENAAPSGSTYDPDQPIDLYLGTDQTNLTVKIASATMGTLGELLKDPQSGAKWQIPMEYRSTSGDDRYVFLMAPFASKEIKIEARTMVISRPRSWSQLPWIKVVPGVYKPSKVCTIPIVGGRNQYQYLPEIFYTSVRLDLANVMMRCCAGKPECVADIVSNVLIPDINYVLKRIEDIFDWMRARGGGDL